EEKSCVTLAGMTLFAIARLGCSSMSDPNPMPPESISSVMRGLQCDPIEGDGTTLILARNLLREAIPTSTSTTMILEAKSSGSIAGRSYPLGHRYNHWLARMGPVSCVSVLLPLNN